MYILLLQGTTMDVYFVVAGYYHGCIFCCCRVLPWMYILLLQGTTMDVYFVVAGCYHGCIFCCCRVLPWMYILLLQGATMDVDDDDDPVPEITKKHFEESMKFARR